MSHPARVIIVKNVLVESFCNTTVSFSVFLAVPGSIIEQNGAYIQSTDICSQHPFLFAKRPPEARHLGSENHKKAFGGSEKPLKYKIMMV